MSESRITVCIGMSEDGKPLEVQVYANKAGIRRLIDELSALDERNDHFHLFSGAWGGYDLGTVSYEPKREIVADRLKVLFRTDAWDAEHFPEVMKMPSAGPLESD